MMGPERERPFEPFLQPPLDPEGDWVIAQGWLYEPPIFGLRNHGAVDFEAPRGTEVRAAADGHAIATFEEYAWKKEGEPPKLPDGEPVFYGSGLIVQIWHGKGRYTQYGHLHTVSETIPYFPPEIAGEHLLPSKLRVPVAEYPKIAYRVRQGEAIGNVGMTGMGKGRRTYEDWQSGAEYTQYEPDHLHFAVAGKRAPRSRKATTYDPFGLYSTAEYYPRNVAKWPKLKHSLWSDAQ